MGLENTKILITGATGSLGKQLVYQLVKSGIKPLVQVRATSDTTFIDSLGLEKRIADVRDKAAVEELVAGVSSIIHTAAWVNFRQDRSTEFTAINTFGTAQLFRAAARAGVKRFIQVSTVAAVGAVPRSHHDEAAAEDWAFNLGQLRIPYILTKRAAETTLGELAEERDIELVIVNPSIIVAPSRTGDDRRKALKSFSRRLLPSFPNRVNLVDLRDVASATIAALERGRNGERYILAGENILIRELLLTMASILDRSLRLIQPPRWMLNLAARGNVSYSRFKGRRKISFYPDLVKMMDYDWTYSSAKAERELDFKPRPLRETLGDLLTNSFAGSYMKP